LQEQTKRLGYAPLGRLLISLSLPSVAAAVTLSLYNIVDTFWVARLGHEAIAALTIVFPYQILIIAMGVGSGIGIEALVSRRFGEQNIEATNHAAGQIFFLSAFFGLIFMMAAILFPDTILTAFGATPDIMEYGTQYLVVTAYGVPQMVFALIVSNLLRGSGDAVKPMIILITASVINIILDPLMIFGIGPFPEMGVRGAALATVIAQSFGAGLSLYYLLAHKSAFRIKISHLKPNISILRDIYRIGFPSMVLEAAWGVSFILFNNVVSSFGSMTIAAAGIVIRVTDLAFMPIIGVSNGLLPIVGFNFGARIWKRLWGSVRLASIGIAALLGFATVLMEIFAPQIIGIFSDAPELLEMAIPAMRIMLATFFLLGPTMMFITTFQGLSRGTEAMALSLMYEFVFFIPLLYLLNHIMGLYGIWLSMPISDLLSFIVAFLFIYREYRRQRKTGVWGDMPEMRPAP